MKWIGVFLLVVFSFSSTAELKSLTDDQLVMHYGQNLDPEVNSASDLINENSNMLAVAPIATSRDAATAPLVSTRSTSGITIELSFMLSIDRLTYFDTDGAP